MQSEAAVQHRKEECQIVSVSALPFRKEINIDSIKILTKINTGNI